MPPIPTDRSTRASYNSEVNGSECINQSANAIVAGSQLNLISGSNAVSWGIWQFADLADLSSVQAVIDVPPNESVYLALADYSRGCWEFDGPLDSGKTLQLDESRHRSQGGVFSVAAITFGGDNATVYKFVLTTESEWRVAVLKDQWGLADPCLVMVDGNPAVCWANHLNYAIEYVRSGDATGETWGEADSAVMSIDGVGSPSLAMVGARPAICYLDGPGFSMPSQRLRFLRANDNHGYIWGGTPADILNSSTTRCSDLSLTMIDGNPAVSFIRKFGDDDQLMFARADDSTGSAWSTNTIIEVLTGDLMGTKLVLRMVYPYIGFSDATNGHVKMAGSTSEQGDTWLIPSVVVGGLGAPTEPFAAAGMVGSSMAFAYCDAAAREISFARYNLPDGEWEHYSLDTSAGPAGGFSHPAMAIVNGFPAVCYFDEAAGSLKYVAADNPDGTSWPVPQVVDHFGGPFSDPELADINGKAGVIYLAGDQQIRYAYNIGP